MNALQWKDSYSLNIETIDSQHKKIVELINNVLECINKNSDNSKIKEVIEALYQYTITHFTCEETLMKVNSYHAFDSHKKTHEKL